MGCSALAKGKFSKVRVTFCQWLQDRSEAERARDGDVDFSASAGAPVLI